MKIFFLKFIKNKFNLFILITYLILAIIFTYPLILHLDSFLPGWPMDGFNYLWNIDTFWFELLKGNNPFFTQRIFYPIGTRLIFHTYAPFISILGIFFLTRLVFYLNILIIISLVTASYFSFLLINYLSKNRMVSFCASLFYGFSPIMISYIWSQHYYFLFASSILPLGILFLLKFFRQRNSKYLLYMILIFWSLFFTDYYITVLFLILVLIILGGQFFTEFKNTIKFFKLHFFPILLIIFFTLALPALIYFFLVLGSVKKDIDLSQSNSFYPGYCNTNISEFITPSHFNPLLANIHNIIYQHLKLGVNYDTPSYFTGWLTLLLFVIFLFRNRKNKDVIIFSIYGLIIFLLSLGNNLKIGNLTFQSRLLPFIYFSKLPFMNFIDCPLRFPIGIQLVLSVVLAIGVSKLWLTKNNFWKKAILFLLITVFIFEYGATRLYVTPVEYPNIYKVIQTDPNEKSVLELPSGITESKGAFGYDWSIQGLHLKQLYWQTTHKKPRIGGYTSRLSPNMYNFYKTTPVLSSIFKMTSRDGVWDGQNYKSSEVEKFLKDFQIGYIVLSPNPRQKYFSKITEDLFGNFIAKKEGDENYILYILKDLQ